MNRLWKNFQTFEMIKNSEQTKENTTNSCIISGEKEKKTFPILSHKKYYRHTQILIFLFTLVTEKCF